MLGALITAGILLGCGHWTEVGRSRSNTDTHHIPGSAKGVAQTPSEDGALSLVRTYLQRDGEGSRLSDDAWSKQAVTWEEESGWDEVTVVRWFQVHRLASAGDTARVEVRFNQAGIIEPKDETTYQFVPRDSTEIQVFKVVKNNGRWKIADPQIEPHVRVDVAAHRYSTALDSVSLQKLKAVHAGNAQGTMIGVNHLSNAA